MTLLLSGCMLITDEDLRARLGSMESAPPGDTGSPDSASTGEETGETTGESTGDESGGESAVPTDDSGGALPTCEGGRGVAVSTAAELESAAAAGGLVCLSAGTYAVNLSLAGDVELVGEGAVVLDGGGLGNTVRYAGTGTLRLADLDITGGLEASGAGLRVDGGTLELDGVALSGNTCASSSCKGAGLYLAGVTATLRDVTIDGNDSGATADTTGVGAYLYASDVTLDGVEVTSNTVTGDGDAYGIGLALQDVELSGSDLLVRGNTGTGVPTSYGAGLFAVNPVFDVTRVRIDGNAGSVVGSGVGGGAHLIGSSGTISNLVVAGNTSGTANGGGLYVYEGVFTIENADFVGNRAPTGSGGAMVLDRAEVTLTNVILAFNAASYSPAISEWDGGTVTASYVDVWENEWDAVNRVDTIITVDPDYTDRASLDAADWDLHLGTASACIDAGDPGMLDVDGTRSDLGGYGGPAGSW